MAPATILGLPVGDAQFWAVTAVTALAVLVAARRIARSLRGPSGCAGCPKAAPRAAAADDAVPRRGRLPVLLALLALSAPAGLAAEPGTESAAAPAASVVRRVAAMGTALEVRVDRLARAAGLELAEALVRAVEDAESRLSTWRDDSELARLNRAPLGAPVELAPGTFLALGAALGCAAETAGAFDPTVAALVEAWGLRGGGRIPSAEELAAARARVDWRALALDSGRSSAVRRRDVRVEEGGFGKGAALDEALALARERSPRSAVVLDFGGQIAWVGQTGEVRVRLADPRDRARAVLELRLDRPAGSVSTSSNSERAPLVGGARVGHLLDPRTGRPAADFGSATVVAASALRADCGSTGLFVLGPRGAPVGAAAPDEERVLLVVEGPRLRAVVSGGLAGRARALVDKLTIEVEGESS